MGRTFQALLSRGIDSKTATALINAGHNIASLKTLAEGQLVDLGVEKNIAAKFVKERRNPIPDTNVVRLLFANRASCCVCRQSDVGIIIHHIEEYAESKDHSLANLAVLCLHHHNEAHSKKELSLNLNKSRLRGYKAQWEAAVAAMDTRQILSLADLHQDAIRFDYINHFRIYELARSKRINFKDNPYYERALRLRLIEEDGSLGSMKALGFDESHMGQRYDFGDGMHLYPYVFELVKQTLRDVPIINISDHLDTGFLRSILRSGDTIVLQGAHQFKRNVSENYRGCGQTCLVTRKLKNIALQFSIDLWDACSNSARGVLLSGRRSCMSVVTLRSLEKENGQLILTGSALVIGAGFDNLKTRDYSPYRSGIFDYDANDDDDLYWEGISGV